MRLSPKLRDFWNIFVKVFGLAALAAFLSFPFLNNFIDPIVAQGIWYPSLVFVVIIGILSEKSSDGKKIFSYLQNASLLPTVTLFLSAFIINYYDTSYNWYWAVFVFIAIGIPAIVFGLLRYTKEKFKPSIDSLRKMNIRSINIVLFWWLLDMFYLSWFQQWIIWQFILGGLSMIIIFYNLTFSFIFNRKSNKWFLLQDFLIGVALTVYLLYLVSDKQLQDILIPVISSIYGGLITLVGVALTIRESQRINLDKHREEIKPLFFVTNKFNALQKSEQDKYIYSIFSINQNSNDTSRGEDIGAFKNTSKSEFVIERIVIGETDYWPVLGNVVERGCLAIVQVREMFNPDIHTSTLIVKDIEGNVYKYQLKIEKGIITAMQEVKDYEQTS